MAEFDLQLLVAQRPETVEVKRAVVAERRNSEGRSQKATLDVLGKRRSQKVSKAPRIKA